MPDEPVDGDRLVGFPHVAVEAVVPITAAEFMLAEGPVWDARRERVLWVDIERGLVLEGRLEAAKLTVQVRHEFESYVGAVAVAADGALVVAQTNQLTRIGVDGARTSTKILFPSRVNDRFNDGACDANGRFLVGTLSIPNDFGNQRLLSFDRDGVTVLDDDLGLSNGLAFAPDDDLLYNVDSVPGRVWARRYDAATGSTGQRRLLIEIEDGTPDGLCVDANGNLWIAMWGQGEVRCYSSIGQQLGVIHVPAPHTTSVAFVGPRLDELLITTARTGLTESQLEEFPLSGSLFITHPNGPVGLPTHRWSGTLPA